MPNRKSNVIDQVRAALDAEPAVVWGAGPNTAWAAVDPAEQIDAALQAVRTRTALDPATAKDGVTPLYLVLNTVLLAAATATRGVRAQLRELADRGPEVDVHPVLAVSSEPEEPRYLHGEEFAVLVRVLSDLHEGIDMGPDDLAKADKSYVAALFSLLRAPLDAASAEALGPDYVAAPDAPQNQVAEAAREVLRAADGVWDVHVVRRWQTLLDRRPHTVILVDEAAQLLKPCPDDAHDALGRPSLRRAELLARLMSQPGSQVQVFDPKNVPASQEWLQQSSSQGWADEADDTQLTTLKTELVRRGHTDLELIEVDDVPTAKRMLGLDNAQPWHAVRVHFPGDRLVSEREIEEAIRGRNREEALANARWNWPAADRIDYLGHRYEVGDPVVDAENPDRPGRVVTVLDGAAIEDGPRLFVRFAATGQDEEVSRDRIRFTGPDPAQDNL
jgi:hypothetical protein